jgi:micrococcal nuclease
MSRRRAAFLILALTLAAVVFAAISEWGSRASSAPFSARVVRAVDGDTLVVQEASGKQQRIRVIGVDTPEDVDPGKPVQCWSQRAAAFTKQALVGRDVLLVPGHERHDRYGRTLAYVLRSDGLELEAALLRGGYARTLAIAPNTEHAARYAGLELAARKAGRGLWGACPGALAWASGR